MHQPASGRTRVAIIPLWSVTRSPLGRAFRKRRTAARRRPRLPRPMRRSRRPRPDGPVFHMPGVGSLAFRYGGTRQERPDLAIDCPTREFGGSCDPQARYCKGPKLTADAPVTLCVFCTTTPTTKQVHPVRNALLGEPDENGSRQVIPTPPAWACDECIRGISRKQVSLGWCPTCVKWGAAFSLCTCGNWFDLLGLGSLGSGAGPLLNA